MSALKIFKKPKKEEIKTAPVPAAKAAVHHPKSLRGLLKKPHLTEKAQRYSRENKYVFMVEAEATKPMIKEEIQKHYGVKVGEINIIRTKGKARHIGRLVGHKNVFKKAIVTLPPGQKIEIT